MTTRMNTRQFGSFQVGAIGLGCMNLSHAYGVPPSAEQGESVLLAALDAGVTMFDTAALYGFGANEALLGQVLSPHRSRFTLASKGGVAGVPSESGMKRVIDGRPEALRRNCEDSLRRLRTDVIDLYYLHRWDKKVAIEDSVGALSDLVRRQGARHRLVRGVGCDLAQGPRGASHQRGADRVLVVDAQSRDRRARRMP
jgi:aryl-alcohol dehydrogenase-like predicted oxidoreductase